jgi:hypothetical protein
LYTAFYGGSPLSYRDTNAFNDVYVFSTLGVVDQAAPVSVGSFPTVPCATGSQYKRLGVRGAHENVTAALIPSWPDSATALVARRDKPYEDRSVARYFYRIDISGTSTKSFARTADVMVALHWDNGGSDYDLYVYDATAHLLAGSNGGLPNLNNGDLVRGDKSGKETEFLAQLPQCTDLRVDIVNYLGLPPQNMTLDMTVQPGADGR